MWDAQERSKEQLRQSWRKAQEKIQLFPSSIQKADGIDINHQTFLYWQFLNDKLLRTMSEWYKQVWSIKQSVNEWENVYLDKEIGQNLKEISQFKKNSETDAEKT